MAAKLSPEFGMLSTKKQIQNRINLHVRFLEINILLPKTGSYYLRMCN